MKRIGIILILLMLSFSLAAYDLDDVESSFETFADETATALPMMAGMGLNWNDAYMGGFPRFGVGLTLGAVFIPSEAFEDVTALTGDESLNDMTSLGVPLPMYAIEGRIGIPIFPMDAGFKVGVLDSSAMELDNVMVGYTMFGGDVRYALIKGNVLMPEVSIGVGYTYLRGEVISPVDDQTIDISGTGVADALIISDTDMLFNWNVNVFDFKVQASKKLLLLNLSAGAGYSYGITSAGGGITNGTVSVDNGGTVTTISPTEIQDLETATGIEVDNEGVLIDSSVNGGAFRIFGGAGLNLPLFKVDFGLNYAVPSQTIGLSANARFQL